MQVCVHVCNLMLTCAMSTTMRVIATKHVSKPMLGEFYDRNDDVQYNPNLQWL